MNVIHARALAAVLTAVALFSTAQVQAEAMQPPVQPQAEYPIAPNAEPPKGLPFNLSLPADLERCHQTNAITQYLDSIAPDDIASLTYLKLFLTDCQRILEHHVGDAPTQEQQEGMLETKSASDFEPKPFTPNFDN